MTEIKQPNPAPETKKGIDVPGSRDDAAPPTVHGETPQSRNLHASPHAEVDKDGKPTPAKGALTSDEWLKRKETTYPAGPKGIRETTPEEAAWRLRHDGHTIRDTQPVQYEALVAMAGADWATRDLALPVESVPSHDRLGQVAHVNVTPASRLPSVPARGAHPVVGSGQPLAPIPPAGAAGFGDTIPPKPDSKVAGTKAPVTKPHE